MSESLQLLCYLIAICSALYCTCAAGIKERNHAGWFLLGAVAPVLAAIAITMLPRLDYNGRPMR